jgi:hypothetical protein
MPIFAPYQGGDPFQVGPNMQNTLAQQKGVQDAMLSMVEKFDQAGQEMDVLRSTTRSIMSQYGVDESGKPSPAAPKYVHDLYKSVEKEGGIGGLSKSSLVAALKGYETGIQVEGQKQQILSAQQANAMKALELQDAERKAEENKRILLAHKLAWETGQTPSSPSVTPAMIAEADAGDKRYRELTGQEPELPTAPANATTAKPALAKQQTKTVEPKTTAERDALELKLEAEGAAGLKQKLEEELAGLESQLRQIRSDKAVPVASVSGGMSGFYPSASKNGDGWLFNQRKSPPATKTLDEINADKIKEPEIVKQIEAKKASIAEIDDKVNRYKEAQKNAPVPSTVDSGKPVGATPITLQSETSPSNENYKIASKFLSDKNNSPEVTKPKIKKLEEEIDILERLSLGDKDSPTLASHIHSYVTDSDRVRGYKYLKNEQGNEYRTYGDYHREQLLLKNSQLTELKSTEAKYASMKSAIDNNIFTPYTAPIGPAIPPEPTTPTPVPSSVAPKSTSKPIQKGKPSIKPAQTQKQQQPVNSDPTLKSDDEKITEEYGMLTSRLQGLGGVPMNWSEDTYRQMRGYAPKIQMIGKGGVMAVGIGDKWQVIKAGDTGMSPSEMASYEKHQILRSSIRTDGMSNKKWTFRGDIRTTETNEAGKVRTTVTDTTRAIDALDRLIEMGDTGLWDSITPTEKSGVITAITNSVQAAGRTEIAGSGAFSEQDAINLSKIVPNISDMSNSVFRTSALARLKEYRFRMAQKVLDVGRVWGFEVAENNDTGLTQEQITAIRAEYLELKKQGMPDAEAQRIAIENNTTKK